MKKIDKIILKAFIGPFIMTFFVCIFILLIQLLVQYFPDLVGKGLGYDIFAKLLFYFSINVTPTALTLSILISSLIAYGNLGEHFELTAIKSAGISLVRTQLPIFIFAAAMCLVSFFLNNDIVPKVNLRAFSLLYDVKQKKPTLEFKEGTFYNGLPGYSIKINKKYEDGSTMKDLIIYNHTANKGNVEVIIADSGKMYTIMNNRYMVMELFKGHSYTEATEQSKNPYAQPFIRNEFTKSKVVFSLESFSMGSTPVELFSSHKIMRNVSELNHDVDSILGQKDSLGKTSYINIKSFFNFLFKVDTIKNTAYIYKNKAGHNAEDAKIQAVRFAANSARSVASFIASQKDRAEFLQKEANNFNIELYKKFTWSFACLVMFLIGAPLGSIIKKGGLGVPILVSIIFFIIYYIFSIVTQKWAKEGIINLMLGMWFTNLLYLPIGLFFLRQAQNDSRIFELDYFAVLWDKLKSKFKAKK